MKKKIGKKQRPSRRQKSLTPKVNRRWKLVGIIKEDGRIVAFVKDYGFGLRFDFIPPPGSRKKANDLLRSIVLQPEDEERLRQQGKLR